jgi:aspartate kinase
VLIPTAARETVPPPADPVQVTAVVPGGASRRVVWKFGGTSVGDLARMRAVAERLVAARREGLQVVAVLSAMGDTTDGLLELARTLSSAPPPRELDALLSLGESLSCAIAAMAVDRLGSPAVSLSGGQAGIVTDDRYGNARLLEVDPSRVVAALDEGSVVLVTGFQGRSTGGDVTTLGRGGSDASAIALTAALGLRECDIFTDVSGVFTADPRVVPKARRLPSVSHDIMLELADAGARVLQGRCVEMAAALGVDIHVRSSTTFEPGTWIRTGAWTPPSTSGVAVAHRRLDPVYSVPDPCRVDVMAALAERGVTPGSIIRGCGVLRFTVPGADREAVLATVRAAGVSGAVASELGSVTVVLATDEGQARLTARAVRTLEDRGIRPELVLTGPRRITCSIPTSAVDEAARALHDAFQLHVERAEEARPDHAPATDPDVDVARNVDAA